MTGFDLVSPLGVGVEDNIRALENGGSAIAKIGRFESECLGGIVPKLDVRRLDRRVDFSGMNNISTYATLAVKRAFDMAGIRLSRADSEKTGLVSAIARGSCESPHIDEAFSNPERRGDVGCFSNVTANSTAGWVSKALELKGANLTLTPGPNGG